MRNLKVITFLLLVTNVVTAFFLIRISYSKAGQTNSSGSGNIVYSATGGIPGCPGNCYLPCCNTSPAFNLTLAYEMVHDYRVYDWQTINQYCTPFSNQNPNQIDTIDARSVWFNLDTLKAFINTIETASCINSSSCRQLQLGVRIYYARYPQNAQLYGVNPSLIGMHTVLMVPTYYDTVNLINVDFDPYQLVPGSCAVSSSFDTLHPFLALAPSTSITARNNGSLIPPPYSCNINGHGYWNSGASFMCYVDSTNDAYGTQPKYACPPTN